MRALRSWGPFLAGALCGSLAASATGVWLALEHPHLLSRLRAQGAAAAARAQTPRVNGEVVVSLDASAAGHPISPFIYGVAFADPPTLAALRPTLNRWGGNTTSRFNWTLGNAWNSARDWEFRNSSSDVSADTFVSQSLAAGASPLLTVPTLGYVARNSDNDVRSVGVPADGGSPVAPGSAAIANYDPSGNRAATSVMSFPSAAAAAELGVGGPAVFEDQWVRQLTAAYGAGSVRYFEMDNEPDLWSYTHTDVHPVRMSYADMLANFYAYASAVKAVDPQAEVLGPDLSGWNAMQYSALDRGADNYRTHADRASHGDVAFLPWWLGQVAAKDRATGRRTLDYVDLHFYPQADGVDSAAADPATEALRVRSVRSLYDPSYTDESWIAQPIELIPRLKQWINQYYPGTKVAITEYRFGAEKDASGGVALAEALGVFGREGVDLASYWTYPKVMSPAGAAFRLYRNYDGSGGEFGDISLPVQSSQQAVAAFAARHSSGGEVDVVLANESLTDTARVQLKLAGGNRPAAEYLVQAGSSTIQRVDLADSSATIALAPLSFCLVAFR